MGGVWERYEGGERVLCGREGEKDGREGVGDRRSGGRRGWEREDGGDISKILYHVHILYNIESSNPLIIVYSYIT